MKLIIFLLFIFVNFTYFNQTDLKEFKSEDYKFSILFLGQPKEIEQDLDSEFGKMHFHVYVSGDPSKIFSVQIIEFPEELKKQLLVEKLKNKNADKEFFDSAANQFISDMHGKMLKEEAVSLGENVGKEVKVELPNNKILRARFFLYDFKMYGIIASVTKENENIPEIEKFLNSFKINN